MTDIQYRKLQEFLDQFPLGFPRTSTGIEIELLKRLFTEEEAELAILLPLLPEELDQIAERHRLDAKELEEKLELMSKKGLVFRIRRGDKTLFRAAPFMIGLYEYSVKKIDRDMARLFKEYYDTAYLDELGSSNIPGFRVMPISENISADMTLFPLFRVEDEIRAARVISVTDCICRKESHLLDDACDYPMETCLSFGVAAEYYIENGIGRKITAAEAIEILNEADKAGLVHAGVNTKHLSNICNCCPCCCASMKGITKKGHDKHKYLNALFEAIVNREGCVGCEGCVDRCPVGAVTIEKTAMVDRNKCLGCGLCAGVCPENVITMKVREDREEPFAGVIDMALAIIEGKRKNT